MNCCQSRDELLLYIDLTCICDMAHRCSPCFGVWFAFYFGGRSNKVPPILFLAGTARDASGWQDCAQGKAHGNNALNQEAARCGKHWNKWDG